MAAVYEHEIRVGWGDCDPARIAYTAHLPRWALEAINGFWEWLLDGDGWFQMELDRGFGTPFVHLEMDFRAPVTPRHRLVCAVRPTSLGSSSIGFRVEGRQAGALCFEGRFACVFVTAGSLDKRAVPEVVRARVTPLLEG